MAPAQWPVSSDPFTFPFRRFLFLHCGWLDLARSFLAAGSPLLLFLPFFWTARDTRCLHGGGDRSAVDNLLLEPEASAGPPGSRGGDHFWRPAGHGRLHPAGAKFRVVML